MDFSRCGEFIDRLVIYFIVRTLEKGILHVMEELYIKLYTKSFYC